MTHKKIAPVREWHRGDGMTRRENLRRASLDGLHLPLDRLAEALAQHTQLAQLLIAQVFVPIGRFAAD